MSQLNNRLARLERQPNWQSGSGLIGFNVSFVNPDRSVHSRKFYPLGSTDLERQANISAFDALQRNTNEQT